MLFFISGNTFAGVTAYILPAGIGTARLQIFQRQIKQNGGQTESALSPRVTHVVVDDNMDVDRALRLLKVHNVPSGVHLVQCTWLSLCISEKKLLDVGRHTLLSPMRSVTLSYIHEFVRNPMFLPNVKSILVTSCFVHLGNLKWGMKIFHVRNLQQKILQKQHLTSVTRSCKSNQQMWYRRLYSLNVIKKDICLLFFSLVAIDSHSVLFVDRTRIKSTSRRRRLGHSE